MTEMNAIIHHPEAPPHWPTTGLPSTYQALRELWDTTPMSQLDQTNTAFFLAVESIEHPTRDSVGNLTEWVQENYGFKGQEDTLAFKPTAEAIDSARKKIAKAYPEELRAWLANALANQQNGTHWLRQGPMFDLRINQPLYRPEVQNSIKAAQNNVKLYDTLLQILFG